MIVKKYLALASFLFGMTVAYAVPAMPGKHLLQQPDGTIVEANIVGDEHFHYYETEAGEILLHDDYGTLRPCVIGSDGVLRAEGTITGKPSTEAIRNAVMATMTRKRTGAARAAAKPDEIKLSFPTTGTVTGLILLCDFQDVKMTEEATEEHYRQLCNERGFSSDAAHGSVIDYFTAQSHGLFTPQFDVFGKVTLPYERAHYGMTNDVNNLFRDAALEADRMGLDFSKYDVNNDGYVDFLFVVFAGHGQAQGGPYDSVWPAMQDLSEYVFDYFDGLNLGVAACSCELKGGSGANLDGISTICHEFGHILGLADIYDTSSQGGHGMGHYDIMDVGTYNDNLRTPPGYTAFEKFSLGWMKPTVLEQSASDIELMPFDESNEAVFIVNPDNTNEYFTLENRQKRDWDSGIPGHGLVISYCHYEPRLWRRNTVNAAAAGYEHIRIMAADNIWITDENGKPFSNEAGDTYPGQSGNTSFTGTSVPAAIWMSSKRPMIQAITNIRESESGTITFDYNSGEAGTGDIAIAPESGIRVEGNTIVAPEDTKVFDMSGRCVGTANLAPGVYVVRSGDNVVKIAIH